MGIDITPDWKSRPWPLFCGILFFCACSSLLAGQPGECEIQGQVVGGDGQPLPQAVVTLVGEGGGLQRETTPDAQGVFHFPGLLSGTYRVEVSAEGYLPQTREDVRLETGADPVALAFRLEAARGTLREVEERAAGERNPNIFIRRVGLSGLRDPLRRRGIEPTFVSFQAADNDHGVDVNAPLRQILFVKTEDTRKAFHGALYESHQNSALNARPFFNVGPLRPSKRNQFGITVLAPLKRDRLYLSSSLEWVRESGFVNGNIRVPLPGERTPLSGDPETNAIVAALLQAYPAEAPNLPNVAPRQLNTNAVRRIESAEWNLKLDYHPGSGDALAFRYSLFDYAEDPFELVVGENPRTDLRPQSFAAGHTHVWSPQTLMHSSFQFDRVKAILVPTEGFRALVEPLGLEGPAIGFGGGFADLSAIGPDRQFPRERFQNRFSGNLDLSHQRGAHRLRLGGRTTRVQVNDLQSNDTRGTFLFASGFGRTTVENFLHGTPIKFTIALGDPYRGFRTWEHALYVQDTYQIRPGLTLGLGLRYEIITAPREINRRIPFFYETDANNLGPQISLAWASAEGSTVLRAGYGIAYGHIFPDIYQRIRYNAPAVRVLPIQDPSLSNPLQGIPLDSDQPSEVTRLSRDLESQYSHQYNLLIQQRLSQNLFFQAGYLGNRTKGPFFPFITNRARPVPGIPLTTATIQQRRPDPSLARILTVSNAGTFYYDALRLGLSRSAAQNLAFDVNYVFGKSINSASNFISTANREAGFLGSQDYLDVYSDMRGPSAFDHRHILTVNYSYDIPFSGAGGLLGSLLGNWTVSGMSDYRSGMWFTIVSSSDGPGFGNVDGRGADRVNVHGPGLLRKTIDDPDTSTSILTPDRFDTNLPPGGRANIPVAAFRADSVNNTNLALTKAFIFSSREQSLQLRAEFQNFFNHPLFDAPGNIFPSDIFGKIVDTQNKGRVIQFTLTWSF